MAVAPNVAPALGVSATGPAGRVGSGSAFTSVDRVEGSSGTPFTSFSGQTIGSQWSPANDQTSGQSNSNQSGTQSGAVRLQTTPLVWRAAAAFAANDSNQWQSASQAPAFLTDLQRAVGIYESNMRITSGSLTSVGSVINRFS